LIDANPDDVCGENSSGVDRVSDNDNNIVSVTSEAGCKIDSDGCGANLKNDGNANVVDANDDDDANVVDANKDDANVVDANDDDANDDEAVNNIADHINATDISSMSSNSKGTTVSVDSLGTLPKEFYDGFYDEKLFPS